MGRATQFRVKCIGYGPACVATLGLALAIAAWGCQKSQSDNGKKEKSVPEMVKGDLPQLGDYLPPLDEGRLEIAPPKEWSISPRLPQYLVRFQSDPNSPYPTILVTASDCDRFKNVTPENFEDFAKFVAAELEAAGAKTTVKMGKIGNLIGVIYTKRAKIKGSFGNIIERRFFDTVVNGRRYRFELQAAPETIGLAEPYLFATVAGTKVVGLSEEEGLAATGTEKASAAKKTEAENKTASTTAGGTPKAEQIDSSKAPSKSPAGETAQKAPETAAAAKPATTPEPKEGAGASQTKPAAKEASQAEATKPEAAKPQEQKPAEAKPAEKPKEEKPQQQGGTNDILKDVDALLQ